MERGDEVRFSSTAGSATNGTSPLPPAGEAPTKHIGGEANAIQVRRMGNRTPLPALASSRTPGPGRKSKDASMADEASQPRAETHADGVHAQRTRDGLQPSGSGVRRRRLRVREVSTQESEPAIAELMT
jgi:hypothetical protein